MIRRSPAIVPGPRLERHPAITSAAVTRPACLAQVVQHLKHGYLRGQCWRDMARHLVEAHGADSGSLIGYAPTLEDAPRRVDGYRALRDLASRPRKAGPARGLES